MDIINFIKNFSSCLHHTPPSDISAETHFKKLEEWSSIFALIVIAMVDAEYGKVLTSEDIHSADTISDLFKIIQSK